MKGNIIEREPYFKFKKYLSDNDIKQKELAENLGKSLSFINKALNRRGAEFTITDFIMIRDLYDITIHDYF